MRFLRSLVIGALCLFPSMLIGLLIWLWLGSSYDNTSLAVIIPCNLIPLGGMFVGFWLAWKTGNEYSLSIGDTT